MVAALFMKGTKHHLYLLSVDNSCDVEEFLFGQHRNKRMQAAATTMYDRLKHAADEGFKSLPSDWTDCRREPKFSGPFCEFRCKDCRISFFYYPEGRVLLPRGFPRPNGKRRRSMLVRWHSMRSLPMIRSGTKATRGDYGRGHRTISRAR